MRNKILKTSLLFVIATFVIIGVSQMIKWKVVEMQGNGSQMKAGTTAVGKLVEGENPETYNYNIHPGTFSPTGYHEEANAFIPIYRDYQIYCIEPGGDISNLSGPKWKEVNTYTLPPAIAYIVSDAPIGQYSLDKQRGVWNIGKNIDGFLHSTNVESTSASGPSSFDAIAPIYAKYDEAVRGKGLQPTDKTNLDDMAVKVNQNTKEYTVGPLNVTYTEGIAGDIAFSGISEITVSGYNSKGEKVQDNIKIEKIILKDQTTGLYGNPQEPEYFEPSKDLKVDTTEQVYPKSGQDFQIIFKDPTSELSSDNPNKVVSISVKVKFKYMLVNGKYTELKGEVVHNDTGEWEAEQWLMTADAIRNVYEEEIELGKKDDETIKITIDLSGRVWEDDVMGKESEIDGIRQDEEKPVPNIPVVLYDDTGKVVGQTTTDADGKYEFKDLDAMRKYYVEFKYNGQQYQNTKYANILDDRHSVATETTGDRDAINKKFEEIDGDEGYTLEQLDYSDKYYNTPDIFTISAFTGSDGKNKIALYPEQNQFTIGSNDTVSENSQYPGLYKEESSIKYIDLGITKRPEFDAALKKDLLSAVVKVNGKTEIYGYDKKQIGNNDGTSGDTWTIQIVGAYDRDVDDTDWNFRGQNGNKDGLLQVYVTYKVAVRNQSMSMLGHITKLYDYYDETYEYVPELSWQSDKNYGTSKKALEELRGYIESGSASSLGKQPKVADSNNTLTIDVDKKQKTGETQYIYLTFKIKNDESGKVSLGKKTNTVEIGAFKTYYQEGTKLPHYAGVNDYVIPNDTTIAGRVDKDSIPNNMGRNGEPKEDDEDNAPGLDVKLTGKTRTLNGTAWEDERTRNENGAIIGNGVLDENEVKIAGIKVQLVEKTVWNGANPNGEYIWAETTTGADGKYQFGSYPAGDYIVRFTYGEDLSGASKNDGKSYNGQDYKTTTYQAGIEQTGTTDLDGKYPAYTNVTNQNATGTYGYNIATKKDNVSDAKDIWADRQKVIDYSKENVTNHKAEVLASPYVTDGAISGSEAAALTQELIENTRMTAETGVIAIEVERNMQSNEENGEPSYSLENVNIGLEERPKAQLEIDKSISNIKVTLANGSILFDVNKSKDDVIWKDHKEYNAGSKKDAGKYEEYYGVSGKHRYSYRDQIDNSSITNADRGLVQLTMDEELMHGATIEILYKVKVTNVGEVDYEGQSFYYTGKGGSQVVTTRADQIVDYVANNLQYVGGNANNTGWNLVKAENLIAEGLVNNRLLGEASKFNNILETTDLNKALVPAEYSGDKVTNADAASVEKTLLLTQLITPENTDDNLTYSNMVEIVKTSNTVGRRMAYSIVGNQNPTAENASEIDSSMAEKVIILPPFGDTHIYYILGAVISIILIGGIAFTLKKVLKK